MKDIGYKTESSRYVFGSVTIQEQMFYVDALCETYDYDAFGNELNPSTYDTNPFRYCAEYFDTETGQIYLRNRYYQPIVGRFSQRDTHWNTTNMIYGDEVKIKEYEDYLGLNKYTVKLVDYAAIRQSGNLYGYCLNNPLVYIDPNGEELFTIVVALIIGGATLLLTGCSAQDSNAWLAQNQADKATPILNFTNTAFHHMQDPNRYVPATVLHQAITGGVSFPDPQGSTNAMMYYHVITKNGKQYNLEVLYDESTNTVYHFLYTDKAIGPLEQIDNSGEK